MRRRTHPKAQILIEVIVGLAMVSVVLVALMSLSIHSLQVQISNKLKQQTSQLNRESMEVVRQIRDGLGQVKVSGSECPWNWSNTAASSDPCQTIWVSNDWTYFRLYYETNNGAAHWVLEAMTNAACNNDVTNPKADCYKLSYNKNTNQFGYKNVGGFTATTDSIFYRQIRLRDRTASGNNGVVLSKTLYSILSWRQASTNQKSEVYTVLSMW